MKKKQVVPASQPSGVGVQYKTKVLHPLGSCGTEPLMIEHLVALYLLPPGGHNPYWGEYAELESQWMRAPTSVNRLAMKLSIPLWSGAIELFTDAQLIPKIAAVLDPRRHPKDIPAEQWRCAHGSASGSMSIATLQNKRTAKALQTIYRAYPCLLYIYDPFRRMLEWQQQKVRCAFERKERESAVKWLACVYQHPGMSQRAAKKMRGNAASYPIIPELQGIWLETYADVVLMREVWRLLQTPTSSNDLDREFEKLFAEVTHQRFRHEWLEKIKSKDKPIEIAGTILDDCIKSAAEANNMQLKSRRAMCRQIVEKIKQHNEGIINVMKKRSLATAKMIVPQKPKRF